MLVGGLFLVIIVFNQARQPERWRWLTGEAPPADESEVDTRVRTIDEGGSGDLPGTIVATGFQFRPDSSLDDRARAARRAEMDIWKQQLESLSWTQRREVARVLKAARDNEPLTPEQSEQWQEIFEILDERWQTHIASAKESVMVEPNLSDQDKEDWLLILVELANRWEGSLRSALASAADPTKLNAAQKESLQQFESLYDEMAMAEIRDDTVISRPNEVNAWFRLVENLKKAPIDQLEQLDESAAPRVGFRQLHQQPRDYRGRMVRIRGAARMAYHVDAPPNVVGVEGYYVFVVMPAGGPNSPIMVYTLELPPGFPEVKDRDVDGTTTDLNEEVEFTGYFFKRMAYLAQDGTRIAPLLIAKSPTWTPREVRQLAELPDWRVFLAVVVGLALASTGIAMFVYVKHRKSSIDEYGSIQRASPQQFAALADEEVLPSPSEALAELAQQSGTSDNESSP
jgi:hypothetical protein